jgi:hypothetical protein
MRPRNARATTPCRWRSASNCVVVAALLVLAVAVGGVHAARKPSEWARMSDKAWEAAAAEWDEDDDPEERMSEDQFEYARMMRAKDQGLPAGVRRCGWARLHSTHPSTHPVTVPPSNRACMHARRWTSTTLTSTLPRASRWGTR